MLRFTSPTTAARSALADLAFTGAPRRVARTPIQSGESPAEAFIGGGARRQAPIAGFALAIPGGDALQANLRLGTPPVVGYVREGCLMLDLRTVDERDDSILIEAVRRAVSYQGGVTEPVA